MKKLKQKSKWITIKDYSYQVKSGDVIKVGHRYVRVIVVPK